MTICGSLISPSFKLIILHNHFQKQKKQKMKPRIKLDHKLKNSHKE